MRGLCQRPEVRPNGCAKGAGGRTKVRCAPATDAGAMQCDGGGEVRGGVEAQARSSVRGTEKGGGAPTKAAGSPGTAFALSASM